MRTHVYIYVYIYVEFTVRALNAFESRRCSAPAGAKAPRVGVRVRVIMRVRVIVRVRVRLLFVSMFPSGVVIENNLSTGEDVP